MAEAYPIIRFYKDEKKVYKAIQESIKARKEEIRLLEELLEAIFVEFKEMEGVENGGEG